MGQRVISAVLTLRDRDFSSNLRRASDRADDFGRGITRVGNQIQRFGQGATRIFKTVGAGVAALGAAGIAGFGASVGKTILDMGSSLDMLEVQTGATASQMEVYGSAAKEVFGKGYGENIDEVTNALARVKQNMHNIDNGELSNVTSKAMLLGKTFDSDVNEVTRGTNNMMEAFGISADKAFDLFTAGGQRGLNFSNEMFDNVAEYSSLFGNMGYSAEEYFGIMERGAKAGVYNLDYVNDVMKEFQIRVKDGSKSTDETFSAMSKSTFDLWESFNRGETSVAEVASAVTAELKGMDDQVTANQLAVALFGTKWEDLEAGAMYAMLGSKDAMKDFEGATESASAKVEGSLKNRLISSWRELQVGIADVVNGAGAQEFLQGVAQKADELVPKIQGVVSKAFEFGNTVRENWGPIKETLIGVGTAVGVVAAGMGTLKVITTVTTMVQGFKTAMGLATAGQWAMNTAMLASPLTWVVVGIAAVVAAGVLLYRNWDTVKAKAGELWAKTTEVFGGIYDWAAQKIQPVTSFFKSLYDKFIDFKNAITSFKPPEWVSKIGGAIGKGIGAVKNFVAGSHATGLNSVPYDGYIAELHKGEMIIPQRQSERIRQAGGTIDNVDQMMGQQPAVTTNTVTTTTTNNTETVGKGAISIVIENIHAKGVTVAEVINELVPLLKLHLSNI
ncbi:phage tail tape measure protein [Lysinibacillus fusiformis]|uniref:phage tail tape measure protein n=1 Tax=Lysinibacillus fusiformis TaxID=28031 RepID=UPI001967A0C8|nr:phage tail tape measure protein [Lysinibacillus fusiformis]QSB10442.1 phage tail tape measure protein [Lysinibacillus fusiformis]